MLSHEALAGPKVTVEGKHGSAAGPVALARATGQLIIQRVAGPNTGCRPNVSKGGSPGGP